MIRRLRLEADVVYNGLGTPREGGAAVLQEAAGERRLVMLDDAAAAARAFPEAPARRAGFAISPPPVNAHTHLDLSGMAYTPGDYTAFVRAVIAHGRRDDARGRGLEAARRGVAELRAAGVHLVGDVVADEAVMRWLLAHPDLGGVAYWEVIGPDAADAERIFDETLAKLRAFRALERPGGVRVGVSPHAPHTVSAPLLQKLAQLAAAHRLPLQIHAAESPAEAELHRSGRGPLMELMAPLLGGFRPSGGSVVGYLEALGVLAARPTLVHMVQVDEADVRAVQRAGCVVVHCPRSNAALNCGRFPWELYMKHGASVALGTDSRGSSPDLGLRAEAEAARRLHGPRCSDVALVRAVVKGGHRALGMTPPRVLRGGAAAELVAWADVAAAPAAGAATDTPPDGGPDAGFRPLDVYIA